MLNRFRPFPVVSHRRLSTRALRLSALTVSIGAWMGAALSPVSAANNWTGGTDALWDTPSNWSLTLKPLSTDDVVFQTPIPLTGATVTLGTGEVANSIEFDDAYTLTGGDLTLTSGTVNVLPAVTAIVNSTLAGAGGVTKAGNGTLILGGTNTYAGATNVNQGVLSFSASTNLGNAAATNTIALGGGSLQWTGAAATSLGTTRTVAVSAISSIDTVGTGALTINGVVSGSAALEKKGTGTLILSGANSYTGTISLNAGTLQFGADNNLGAAAAALNIDNNATLRFSTTAAAATNSHLITVGAGGATFEVTNTQLYFNTASKLAGSGTLTVKGAATPVQFGGNLRLATAQAGFTGSIVVAAGGSIEYGIANAVPSTVGITLNGDGTGNFATSGELGIGSGLTAANPITANGGILSPNNGTSTASGAITLQSGGLVVGMRDWYNYANVRSFNISGAITGTGGLTVIPGTTFGQTLTLSNAGNTYGGNTTITSAYVVATTATSIGATNTTITLGGTNAAVALGAALDQTFVSRITTGSTGAVALGNVASSNNLDFTGYANLSLGATGSAAYTGVLTPNGSTYRLGGAGGTLILSNANAITGARDLVVGLSGVAVLANNNNYTGTTTVNAGGTLQIGNGGLTGSFNTAGALTINGTLSYNRQDDVTFNTAYTGTATFNQAGVNTLNLAAPSNAYPRLQLSNSGRIDIGTTTANVGVDGGNLMQATGGSISATINATGGGKIQLAFNNGDVGAAANSRLIINAPIANGAGSAMDIYNGGIGAVVLAGANTYTGATAIQSGQVYVSSLNRVSGGTASSSLGAPTTVANGTIGLSVNNASSLIYTGTGETTDRVINLAGTTAGATLEQAGSGTLGFSSNFTATGGGSKTLTLQGNTSGTGVISGNIVDNTTTNKTSLTKAGSGTWFLRGANTYTGTTAVNGGTLVLDFANATPASNIVSSTSVLSLGGGTLNVTGKASTTNLQTFASTTLAAGGSAVTISNDPTANPVQVDLKTITRASGGTIKFTDPANGAAAANNGVTFANAMNGAGILGGWATFGSDWAIKSGTNNPAPLAAGSYAAFVLTGGVNTANYLQTPAAVASQVDTLTGAVTANTVKIVDTAATQSLALGASNLTVSSLGAGTGGIMYAGGSTNAYTISGTTGALTAGANDLIVSTPVAGSTLTISAIVGGTGGLTKSGDGTLLLTNTANTFTGNIYVNGGTLAINAPTPTTSADTNLLGTGNPKLITLSNGGTFSMVLNGANNGYNPTGGSKYFVMGSGGGVFDMPTGVTLVLDDGTGNGTGTTNAQLQGSGKLTKRGAGTLTLGYSGQTSPGFQSFTGDIVVEAGLLNAGNANALGSAVLGTTTVQSGASIEFYSASATYTEPLTINGTGLTGTGALRNQTTAVVATLNGPITLASDSAIGGSSTGGIVINGAVSGGFALSKVGAGLVVLNSPNTYTGGTTISGGTLRIAGDSSLGLTGTNVNFSASGGLGFSLATTLPASRTISVASGATATFDTGAVADGSGPVTIAGVISGAGGILKQDATQQTLINDPLILTANNTFTGGVSIKSGALVITNANALGTGAKTVTIIPVSNPNSFPSLQLDGSGGDITLPSNVSFNTSYDAISGGLPIANGGSIVNLAGNNTINGAFSLNSGGGGTTFTSNGGNLKITGNIASITSAGSARTMYLRGSSTGEISGLISNGSFTVSLTKDDGAGTWTLSNNGNTYNGATTVTAGTLLVTGSISASTSTVSGAGTLGGTGTLGPVNVNGGGILAPGTGAGLAGILASGNAVFGGGTFAVDLNGATAGVGGYDQLNVAGTVAFNSNTPLTVSLGGGYDPADDDSISFTLINNDGVDAITTTGLLTYGGNPLSEGSVFTVGAQPFQISYAGGSNNNDVVLTAVPEPGTAAALLAGLGTLLGLRRRRRA